LTFSSSLYLVRVIHESNPEKLLYQIRGVFSLVETYLVDFLSIVSGTLEVMVATSVGCTVLSLVMRGVVGVAVGLVFGLLSTIVLFFFVEDLLLVMLALFGILHMMLDFGYLCK
jgi:hypothetical protein